jgi:hypothetical protein
MPAAQRNLFLLIISIVCFVIGALLSFKVFGTATVPQLLGVMFLGLIAFAAAHLP